MKYLDEYRDADLARQYDNAITDITTKPWTTMEACGDRHILLSDFG